MSDAPSVFQDHGDLCLSTFSPDTSVVGALILATALATGTATAANPANLAMYFPVMVKQPMRIQRYAWMNGGTVAGNVNIGLNDINGVVVPNSVLGSTAMSGATTIQTAALGTPPTLMPGNYFLAFVTDSTTALFERWNPSVVSLRACGVTQMAANFALGDATFAAGNPGNAFVPVLAAYATPVI